MIYGYLNDIYGKPQKMKNTIGLRVKIHGRKLAKLEPVRIHPACEIGFISSRVLIIHQLYPNCMLCLFPPLCPFYQRHFMISNIHIADCKWLTCESSEYH